MQMAGRMGNDRGPNGLEWQGTAGGTRQEGVTFCRAAAKNGKECRHAARICRPVHVHAAQITGAHGTLHVHTAHTAKLVSSRADRLTN